MFIGYYLMFKFDRVMSGKKAKGFETFVRFNVYKMLMSYHHIFKTGISLNKSEAMTAVPVPHMKKIGKQYETEIVYFNSNNVKNYIFYTIGNTDCHQLKDIRMMERTYTKIATLKSSFHKKFKNRIVSDEERSLLHRKIYASFEAISR